MKNITIYTNGKSLFTLERITGNTYDSVRTTTQPSKSFPRNLRLAIWVHEQHLKNK